MRPVALSLALLLVACGGSAPVRTHYLLRAATQERAARVEGPARVGLARVVVAPYLDQSGIVVESAAREIRPARNHQWAEPLGDGLLFLLRAELSQALGEDVGLNSADRGRWEHGVEVFVEQLHGTMAGEALLVADFRITSAAAPGEVAEYRFARSPALAREGYPGLVDAEAELARQLAQAIADSLRDVGEARAGP
jgi:uncharacterized lipoprotein YmbA